MKDSVDSISASLCSECNDTEVIPSVYIGEYTAIFKSNDILNLRLFQGMYSQILPSGGIEERTRKQL
ncbi:hypothetical protein EL22_28890 [Halostagnicola sp. A56]|nr:hypothetical protein EL22_28890 [Halostagnicola sp. A56]